MRGRCRQHRVASFVIFASVIASLLLIYQVANDGRTPALDLSDSRSLSLSGLELSVNDDGVMLATDGRNHRLVTLDSIMDFGSSLNKSFRPDFSTDVLVFLHIQKTAGTYLGSMVAKELDVTKHGAKMCKCWKGKRKCDCHTDKGYEWIFSRYSTGWRCGLHADWTELTACVDTEMNRRERIKRKRTYHYLTFLRQPTHRYVSEFLHVRRGATWKTARLLCGGRPATEAEWPRCFDGANWRGVELEEFASCRSNLATNRQTRMLADLNLVHCYNTSAMTETARNAALIESASKNLREFSYFGVTEFLILSQYLFETTFAGLRFRVSFTQSTETHSSNALSEFEDNDRALTLIAEANQLDEALYAFASRLFFARVRHALLNDAAFKREGDLYEALRDANDFAQVRSLAGSLTDYVHRRFFRTRAVADGERDAYEAEGLAEQEPEYDEVGSAAAASVR